MDYKAMYDESRRLVEQARGLLEEYKDKEMPGDVAEQFDRLMEESDAAKTRADRLKAVVARDAELKTVAAAGGTASFEGFEEYEETLPEPLRKAAARLAAPENTLGRADNAAQVKAVAEQLYPAKIYGVSGYEELRWKHWQAFGKWVRGGSSALDSTERKIAFGGRIILTGKQRSLIHL